MRMAHQWVTPLASSSFIWSSSCPERYMTSTKTFLRSSSSVPSTSSPRTKLAIFSCSYRFSKSFLESSASSPVFVFTSTILSCPLPESMMKLQSFFSFRQISLASPTFIVSSQSLSFLARIRVSFSFASCFHCRSAARVRLSLNSPKLLLVFTRESPFLPDLRLLCSSCSLPCRERKLEMLASAFLHVSTFFRRVYRFTNSTHSFSSRFSSSAVAKKPAFSARSKNYSRVRQSLSVFQKVSRSMLFSAAKPSNRSKSFLSPSESSDDIMNFIIEPGLAVEARIHFTLILAHRLGDYPHCLYRSRAAFGYNLNKSIVVCIQMDSRGTVKLFDGLYVGDESSARDQELILLNRVAVVLNLTALPNYYLHFGIQYPQVQWPSREYREIVDAIAQAKDQGESVLIHGHEDLDRAAAAASIYLMERQLFEYEERFRWSLFKTLEFVSSRIEGLTFSQDCFELLKRHELAMLNEQSRLSYNWEQRPSDTEELILRNTYLNSTHKDKWAISTPSKPKIKEKRRISWKSSAVEEVKVAREPSKTKDEASSIRNHVLSSVRKILNKNENSKSGSSSGLLDHKGLSLKKYKSTYTLASLSSLQRLQKLEEVPIVSLNLTQADQSKRSKSQTSIKRAKTEGSETFAISKNQPQITISLKKQGDMRTLGHRRISDSIKKLRTKQQTEGNLKITSNNLFYQKIR